MVAIGLLGTAAAAQTTGQSTRPSTQSPFWGGGPASAQQPDPSSRYGDRYRDRREGFDQAFPVDLVGEVAPAHANYVAMKWGYRTTRSGVWLRVTQLRKQYEASEEYRQLQRDIDEASARLQQARQQAYAPLQEDPEYVAAGELHASITERIRQMHRRGGADPVEIMAMSEKAMEYAQRQRDMELELAGTDEEIQEARERLQELGRRHRDMEAEFALGVREDEELRQMRDQLGQLKIAKLATGAYYDSAVRAANVATTFAYTREYLRSPWYGRTGYYSPYAYSPYYGHPHPFTFSTGSFIFAGPGVGGFGPKQVDLVNPFPPMVGTGVPFVGTGQQTNPSPTIPDDAFR